MGYSMGARNTTFLAMANPAACALRDSRWCRHLGLFGGVGLSPDTIAQGLESALSLADVSDPTAHQFRSFAEQTKSGSLRALAACICRGSRQPLLERDQLARIAVPILVATGTKDTVAGLGSSAGGSHSRCEVAPYSRSGAYAGGWR